MVKKLLRTSALFLNLPQEDILSAGFIIMLLSLFSGFFGFIRDRLLVAQFTPDLVGIYFASFVIPDNILQVLILSAVGAAFIPVFTKYHNNEKQWDVALATLQSSLFIFLIIIVLCMIFTPQLAYMLVPGLQKENPAHIDLLVNLTRIILGAQLFFVISYLCTGILQSYQRFVISASASLFYNIGIIIGILFLSPLFGMYGVGIGIIIGAFLHLAIQLPFVIKLGFSFRFTPRFFTHEVKEIIRLMIPRSLSTAIERTQFTIDTSLASLVSLSSITYLNFASHLAIFPVSLVGAAIGQAALPFFARAIAKQNLEEFRQHVTLSLTHIVFLLAPATVLLVVFHTPIVRLVFGTHFFSWEATVLTSQTLAILALGLIPQGTSNILARGFYALYDTRTPFIVTLISISSAIALSVYFIVFLKFDVRFLALSSTTGYYLNMIILFFLLNKKINGLATFSFFQTISKITIISITVACFSYILIKLLESFFNTNYTLQLVLFTIVTILLTSLLYLFLSFRFNFKEFKELFTLFEKAGATRKRFFKEVFANEK